jgi:hypothetical protein
VPGLTKVEQAGTGPPFAIGRRALLVWAAEGRPGKCFIKPRLFRGLLDQGVASHEVGGSAPRVQEEVRSPAFGPSTSPGSGALMARRTSPASTAKTVRRMPPPMTSSSPTPSACSCLGVPPGGSDECAPGWKRAVGGILSRPRPLREPGGAAKTGHAGPTRPHQPGWECQERGGTSRQARRLPQGEQTQEVFEGDCLM